jgi:hypothetical protein
LDRIAATVEDAEATPDEELNPTPPLTGKKPTAVYSVRIPVERIEELRQPAAERGVAPTALMRTWVLTHLDAAHSPHDYAQRWERDMRATPSSCARRAPWCPTGKGVLRPLALLEPTVKDQWTVAERATGIKPA